MRLSKLFAPESFCAVNSWRPDKIPEVHALVRRGEVARLERYHARNNLELFETEDICVKKVKGRKEQN